MNYTQAAQILGITQPALTQQIKKLEKAIGAPLFGQNCILERLVEKHEKIWTISKNPDGNYEDSY